MNGCPKSVSIFAICLSLTILLILSPIKFDTILLALIFLVISLKHALNDKPPFNHAFSKIFNLLLSVNSKIDFFEK